MTTLFLSYARADDEPFVRRLHADVTVAGFDAWFDKDDLRSRGLTFHQEIKDAIRERERLIYIGGPKASASPYVREEWQLALKLDKPVIPILRLGEYEAVIPGSLALLHCDDFRDDARYAAQLAKLLTNLKLPPPALGKLFGNLPELPAHFQPRPELLRRIKDALLVDLQQPVVVTGAGSRVGLQGMGGIGKSVLAAALARDQEIRRSYPDGIIWVRFGKTPDLEQLQRDVVSYLGSDKTFTGAAQGTSVLRELLLDKSVAFVLDDVWEARHVAEFVELSPRCRAVITTRDAGIVNTIHGDLFQVQLFSEPEALQLLAEATEVDVATLPAEAREVVRECGYLPLALALCVGITGKQEGRWGHVLERLRRADLTKIADRQAIEPQHRSIWTAIHASVEELAEPQRRRFAELSVFGPRGPVPTAAVQTLWAHTGQLDDLDSDDLLAELRDRALVRLDPPEQVAEGANVAKSTWGLSLHDLLYDYARIATGEPGPLHQELLEAYRAKCPSGWWTGPNDSYFYEHLRDHLVEAGRSEQLVDLLQELRWLEAKNENGLTFDLVRDYVAGLDALPPDDPQRRILRLLNEALRRDIHFIARHAKDYPQGLFQCVWNSGWWYDFEDAAAFYVEREGGWSAENAPWLKSTDHKLCRLLELWRQSKQRSCPGSPWLRAIRPPAVHLGTAQLAVLRGHEGMVHSVSYSPDARRIASGSWKEVRLWDAESGAELGVLRGHEGLVKSVSWSLDGRRIASGSEDKTVRVWDAESGVELAVLRGHEDSVTSVTYSASGRRIISGSGDRTVRVWDSESGAELAVLRGHEDRVFSVSSSPDSQQVASGSRDKTIRVWDAESGAELAVLRGHEGMVMSVTYSPDGRRIASGGGVGDKTVRVWDAVSGAELGVLRGHIAMVTSVTYSVDGRRIVSASADGTVRMWDAESRTELAVLRGDAGWVASVSYSPDGRRIASGSGDMTVRVWDAEGGAELTVLRGDKGCVTSVTYSAGGQRIASGCTDAMVRVWDAESGVELAVLRGHEESVETVSWSLDGRQIASGSEDKTVRVWDAESGVELAVLRGHEESVETVSWSLDGRQIASGSEDKTVRVWDAESGVELAVLRGHEDSVTSVTYSVDGRRIVSGSDDNTVRVWDAQTHDCLEIIEDETDVLAIAPGASEFPLVALAIGPETGVEQAKDGKRVAWFPISLHVIVTHPSGRTWAGASGGHLYIMTLEGGNLPT